MLIIIVIICSLLAGTGSRRQSENRLIRAERQIRRKSLAMRQASIEFFT